jgi:hypothetical protein
MSLTKSNRASHALRILTGLHVFICLIFEKPVSFEFTFIVTSKISNIIVATN